MENNDLNTDSSSMKSSNKKGTSNSIKLTTKQAIQRIEHSQNYKAKKNDGGPRSHYNFLSTTNKENAADLNDVMSFELKEEALLKDIERLVHASQCVDKDCVDIYCQKTKWLISHPNTCRNQTVCLLCKKLLSLCSHHATRCEETKCLVIYCGQIKRRFKQLQAQHNQQKGITIAEPQPPKIDEVLPNEFNLVHAYKCSNTNCVEPNCENTKWLIIHSQNCNILKGCTVCKKLFLQCTNHAKCCPNSNCTVLYCKHIKEKFTQLQIGMNKNDEQEPTIKIVVHNSSDPLHSGVLELNTDNCKKTTGRCPICLLVLAICCFHAKNCQKLNCSVPFCSPIKHKLKNQEIPQSL